MAIYTLLFSTLLLPLFSILLLWRCPPKPRGRWIATLFMSFGVTAFSFFAAPWGWFGIPARYLLALLFAVALVLSLRRPPREELREESPLRMIVKVLIGVMFGSVALGVLRAHSIPTGVLDVGFPLRGGSFLVQHGGSESAANMHAVHPAQRFGVDIVQLNGAGTRARGVYPNELDRYAVFGAQVLSPCDGTIVATRDGLPDLTPGTRDEKNKEGNHVVIRCFDANVTLAHLQRGSVAVRNGVKVAQGAPLGRVGNSGNTTEPHLHVHADRNGTGVPLLFGGEWLVRNDVVRR
ncbi:MAG TPA: M23 family metallopeptidase [Thermoanaerobaculia bacterium]|nr:M23 family metallopeptidase [Thermoanaerobaculia bacterium]